MAKAQGLSDAEIKTLGPGKYHDGRGLYLVVRSATARNWSFRYMRDGKAREVGLGSAFAVSLAAARSKAADLQADLKDGKDPLAIRKPAAAERKQAAAASMTFEMVARDFIARRASDWSHEKHRTQVRRSLERHAFPLLGAKPVADVSPLDLVEVLRPLWVAQPETGKRIYNRVVKILSYAAASDLRPMPNATEWRLRIGHLLGDRGGVKSYKPEHYAAIPFEDVPALMAALAGRDSVSAACVRFLALTAVRSQEAAGAKLAEFDLDAAVWTVPAERMKLRKAHRVPLSPQAAAIVRELAPLAEAQGGLLFAGLGTGKPLSQTALVKAFRSTGRNETLHGLRSTFRDWAAETTPFPNHVVEMALAHAIKNEVERAYRRGDLFNKRRELMAAWGTYCAAGQNKPTTWTA